MYNKMNVCIFCGHSSKHCHTVPD